MPPKLLSPLALVFQTGWVDVVANILEGHLEEGGLGLGPVLKIDDVHALGPVGQIFGDDPREDDLGVGLSIWIGWGREHFARDVRLDLELANFDRTLKSNASILIQC